MDKAEFYGKYGAVKVTFSRYYKYMFTYQATLPDGRTLVCEFGGNSDDIYRHEVAADDEETILSLQPESGRIYDNGNEVESFYDR